MKKVLLVIKKKDDGYIGGVVAMINHYLQNAQVFRDRGYEVELFNYKAPAFVEKLPSRVQNIAYGILQAYALSKKLKVSPEAIVHIHTSREFLFLKDLAVARRLYRKNHAKVMMTIHVGTYETVFNRIGFAEKWCMKVMNMCLKKVVFLSDVMRCEFEEKGLKSELSALLYNFHSLTDIADDVEKSADLQLLFTGAIHREKGILELLQAVKNIKDLDVRLDICGQLTDMSIQSEFEALTKELGDKVQLHGYVSGAEKTKIFTRADVLILPSYHEGFPLVILEGLASGCALISTPVGATTEVLTEDNVIWVAVKSVAELESAIKRLYEDRSLLHRTQKNNLERSKDFSIEKNIQTNCLLYDEVLGENRS